MNTELLIKLSQITREEQRLLSGSMLDTSIYTGGQDFIIQAKQFLPGSDRIAIRTHTRFVDFPLHRHNYMEMMYVAQGQITHSIDGKEIPLHAGDLLLINRHLLHAIRRAEMQDIGINFIMPDAFIDSIWPEMSGTLFSPFFASSKSETGSGQYLLFCLKGYPPAENLMENLLYELSGTQKNELILNRTVALLFQYLACARCPLTGATETITTADAQRRKIMQYIKANYQTASLTELADKLHLSAPYLSKLTRELFGSSFQELLLEYRLTIAMQMLKTSTLSVAEIIHKVGYENGSFFHRKFKEKFGTTPQCCRKNHIPA